MSYLTEALAGAVQREVRPLQEVRVPVTLVYEHLDDIALMIECNDDILHKTISLLILLFGYICPLKREDEQTVWCI